MKRAVLAIQSSVDLTDVLFFVGLLMLGYGLTRIYDGAGLALVGLLLILYIRPLSRWIK